MRRAAATGTRASTASRHPARRQAGAPRRARGEAPGKRFARAVSWAFGGAIVFALPTLMTMELWYLGFYVQETRLLLFGGTAIIMFVGLSYYLGFETTSSVLTDVLDAFVAYGVGFITAVVSLALIGVIRPDMAMSEIVGKIAIQVFPCGLGALLARNQLRRRRDEVPEDQQRRSATYAGQLFLMAVGAVFLSFNLAPTEEMVLIAYKLTAAQTVVLAAVTLVAMHGFVWSSPLHDSVAHAQPGHGWRAVLLYSIVGYAIALVISTYMLWTFGRLEGLAVLETVKAVVVLAFPAAIGAAASRLIL